MSRAPTVLSLFDLNPGKFGSMEEYAVFLSAALRERGYRSVLVFKQPAQEPVLSRFRETGAELDVLPTHAKARMYAALLPLLRRHRAEIVHFHFFEQFSILPLLPRLAGCRKVIFTDHFRQPLELAALTRLQLRLWNALVPPLVGTRVVAVSQHIKRTLVNGYYMRPHTVRVISNGVNLRRFLPPEPEQNAELRRELGIAPGAPVVVCVAALRPEKGVDDLLAAARQVLEKMPATMFVVVGEGPLQEKLQQSARELGIAERVRFTGVRSDVHHFMAMADVVAAPSVWEEPAGLVVLEAMAAARPVVATRSGGIPEHLEDGVSGLLVEKRAPQQFAAALLRLLGAPQEAAAMGRAGRARVETRFSMERWIADTLDAYQTF